MRRLAAVGALLAAACAGGPAREGGADRRAFAQVLASSILAELEAVDPAARERLGSAAGWVALGTTGASVIASGRDDGVGVLHDNATGAETYLRVSLDDPESRYGRPRVRIALLLSTPALVAQVAEWGIDPVPAAPPGTEVIALPGGALSGPNVLPRCRPDAELNER